MIRRSQFLPPQTTSVYYPPVQTINPQAFIQYPPIQQQYFQPPGISQQPFPIDLNRQRRSITPTYLPAQTVQQSPQKKIFQQGFDLQEENKILKNYIRQMETTIQQLDQQKKLNTLNVSENSSYGRLLEQQHQENIVLRENIEKITTEIQLLRQEGQYLRRLRGDLI